VLTCLCAPAVSRGRLPASRPSAAITLALSDWLASGYPVVVIPQLGGDQGAGTHLDRAPIGGG
jgi:hypothetical protein